MFHITEKDDGFAYFKDLELHTLELKKFAKDSFSERENQEILEKIKSSLDLWMAFLTRHDLLSGHLPPSSEGMAVQRALGVLEAMNFKEEERENYEARLKWLRVETNTLKKYEANGFEKGIKQGIEQGKAEEKIETSYAIALNLLNLGLSLEKITEATGLSISTLEDIRKT